MTQVKVLAASRDEELTFLARLEVIASSEAGGWILIRDAVAATIGRRAGSARFRSLIAQRQDASEKPQHGFA
ncbi:MAG: hypothetical protein M0015_08890 [Betaproteobacteria bacterium]|nr:hypothetical protein [Betaproteobacteria bacterium]